MKLTHPVGYLFQMALFVGATMILMLILGVTLIEFYYANIFLNSLILVVFVVGVVVAFRQVLALRPEIRWINNFRRNESGGGGNTPKLLAPLAAILVDGAGRVNLSASSLRSILDSIGARIDESRDLNRYLIGLLVFLGLLGTFWGLLQTVSSISDVIGGLSVGSGGDAGALFQKLRSGLQKPLDGMSLAFSTSLMGLGSSLLLGYIDLKATGAQSRFYNELEDWLTLSANVSTDEESSVRQMAQLTQAIQRLVASHEAEDAVGSAGALPGAPPRSTKPTARPLGTRPAGTRPAARPAAEDDDAPPPRRPTTPTRPTRPTTPRQ